MCHNTSKVEFEDDLEIDSILCIANDEGVATPEFSNDIDGQPENVSQYNRKRNAGSSET